MEIGPVSSDQSGPGRIENKENRQKRGLKGGLAGDRVEISNEARMKLAALADRALQEISKAPSQFGFGAASRNLIPTGSVGRQAMENDDQINKLERARDRIELGFYNRADIKEEIARRLATEFKKSSCKDETG